MSKKYEIIDGKKECGKCHEIKLISEFNKQAKHFNSKCKSCVKIYIKEYDKNGGTEKKRLYKQRFYTNQVNRDIRNETKKKYRKQEEVKKKDKDYTKNWTLREKLKAIDYKGGCCIICNYSICSSALEFHHLDPSKKENPSGVGLMKHRKFERNKDELDKCVLICVRCHREVHAGLHPEYLIIGD